MADNEVTIGLEIHVTLKTEEKLYCDCKTNYYEVEEPNINTCEVCTGMPGAKPYPINEKALKTAIMIAKLLNCQVIRENIFVKRKHYNYPDLPSGYQRTSEPMGKDGELEGVEIWEVHLEEDPGRYDLATGNVDYNRSGVPLVEIVTAPDMHSPEEARNFLKELVNLLRYTERIVDVGGVMRADVNISLKDGAKVEIKNINSIKGAYKAIQYEVLRQKNLRRLGKVQKQETRGFNEKQMITIRMRTKETAHDYRYIPDPDIPPLMFNSTHLKVKLPETPQERKKRIIEKYKISEKYTTVMVKDKGIGDLFEEIAREVDANLAARWMCREVLGQLNYRSISLAESKLTPKILKELLTLVEGKVITENTGKTLLERIMDTGEAPSKIVEKEKLGKISHEGELAKVVKEVIKENSDAVKDYQAGEGKALNFLMGKVMQKMQRRADNKIVIKLLKDKLS